MFYEGQIVRSTISTHQFNAGAVGKIVDIVCDQPLVRFTSGLKTQGGVGTEKVFANPGQWFADKNYLELVKEEYQVGDWVRVVESAGSRNLFDIGAIGYIVEIPVDGTCRVQFTDGNFSNKQTATRAEAPGQWWACLYELVKIDKPADQTPIVKNHQATGGYVTVECGNLKYWFTEESYKKLQGLRYNEFTFSNHATFVYDRAGNKFVKDRWNLEEVIDTYMKGL